MSVCPQRGPHGTLLWEAMEMAKPRLVHTLQMFAEQSPVARSQGLWWTRGTQIWKTSASKSPLSGGGDRQTHPT